MKEVPDWTKAPEGATHYYGITGSGISAHWIKAVGNDRYWIDKDQTMNEWRVDTLPSDISMTLSRPASTWNGTDLPPVGTVCETAWNSHDLSYVSCKILAHDEDRAVFRFTSGKRKGEYSSETANSCNGRQGECPQFRPIRTPEQIAAEEREAAIKEIEDMLAGYSYKKCAEIIYEAGFRNK
jgi:hypothetical protein